MKKATTLTGLALGALIWGLAAAAQASPIITPGALTPGLNEGSISLISTNYLPNHLPSSSDNTKVFKEYYGVKHVFTQDPIAISLLSNGHNGTAKTTGVLKIHNSPTPNISTTAEVELLTGAKAVKGGPLSLPTQVNPASAWNMHAWSKYSFQILGAPGQAQVAIKASGSVGSVGLGDAANAFFVGGHAAKNGTAYNFLHIQDRNSSPPIFDITQSIRYVCGLGGDYTKCGFDAIDTSVDKNSDFITPNPSLNFLVSENVPLFTNTVYDVMMEAGVLGSADILTDTNDINSRKIQLSMFANVDPTFTVNGPYTIEVSPGFGGVSVNNVGGSVPEPPVLALMLAGAMSLFGFRRSRRTAWLPA